MIRGLRGLNLIGGDVVEVSPPFDMSGNTALVAVTVMSTREPPRSGRPLRVYPL